MPPTSFDLRPPGAVSGAAEITESMELSSVYGAGDHGGSPGLVLLYAPDYERYAPAYVLSGADLIIGRDPGTGIAVPGGAVSRQHARVRREGGRSFLTDLGGRNGTLVNGRFVTEVALAHLDEIRVGDAIFKFVERAAEGYAHYRIDGAVIAAPGGEARPNLAAGRVVGGYQIQRLAAAIRTVARAELAVVILGESGTGKEVFAQQLHEWSGRRGPFKAINCAAIPGPLLESELFGYKRGAFSGAVRDKIGLVQAANKGTLFLDEIGDMPLEAQAKLLRLLQSKEVTPVGATDPEVVDVRVVCATHRELPKLQAGGAFRGDLFARLNEYSVTLPPLRERKEDLFSLCHALAARHGKPDIEVTVPFMAGIIHHAFPFNVRELEALIKRWIAIFDGPVIDVEHLPDEIRDRMKTYGIKGAPPPSLPPSPAAPVPVARPLSRGGVPEKDQLLAALARHHGNIAAVGREFGRERAQVHRWLKRYGIDVEAYR